MSIGYNNVFDTMQGMGKDDWLKFQINRAYDNPFPELELEARLSPLSASNVVPWEVAAKNVAEDIHANYKNLYVAMSGGIDSEFIARTFLELKIPFTPIICKISDLNELDIWWAYKWCKENNLEPVVIEPSVDDWITRIVDISKQFCGRFGSGSATISFVHDYVLKHQGNLVTGAGFLEYFPDENLTYMQTNFKDSCLHNKDGTPKHGYLLHEPDMIQKTMYPTAPFNFLSWTPEIVLSYVYHRDMSVDSAANKARIMKCLPRPKNIGVPNCFFMLHPRARKWVGIKNNIGTAEAAWVGTRNDIIELLSVGVTDA